MNEAVLRFFEHGAKFEARCEWVDFAVRNCRIGQLVTFRDCRRESLRCMPSDRNGSECSARVALIWKQLMTLNEQSF